MIECMNLHHIDEVAKLEAEIFSSPWPKEAFEYEVNQNPYSFNYVYLKEGKVIGYCGLWCLFEQAQITTIGVCKEYRREKIGSQLMDKMIEKAINLGCETISLEVRVSNEAAKTMYEAYGFDVINIRKSYYQDNNEDAFLMMKAIGGRCNEG